MLATIDVQCLTCHESCTLQVKNCVYNLSRFPNLGRPLAGSAGQWRHAGCGPYRSVLRLPAVAVHDHRAKLAVSLSGCGCCGRCRLFLGSAPGAALSLGRAQSAAMTETHIACAL